MNTPSRHIAPYLIAAAVAAFLIFLAYLMFFVPKMNETKALEEQTATLSASNSVLGAKVAVIGENVRNIGSLEERVEEFNRAFPAGSAQQDLMEAVDRAAKEAGVKLTTLNPTTPVMAMGPAEDGTVAEAPVADPAAVDPAAVDPALGSVQVPAEQAVQPGAGVAIVTLTIGAKGSPESLLAFMEKMESLSRPVLVKSFGFEGQGPETNLSITADSFFVAPLSNPGSGSETES